MSAKYIHPSALCNLPFDCACNFANNTLVNKNFLMVLMFLSKLFHQSLDARSNTFCVNLTFVCTKSKNAPINQSINQSINRLLVKIFARARCDGLERRLLFDNTPN